MHWQDKCLGKDVDLEKVARGTPGFSGADLADEAAVVAVIRDSTGIHEYPMVDRDPLPRWSLGRVTLVGDAVHRMYPVGMDGGSQSIVDVPVLAWALAHHDDPVRALARYEGVRREPLNQLMPANRELGPEKIIVLVEEAGGPVPEERVTAVSKGYGQLAGYYDRRTQLP
ncbi:FAD-dependent monooxygenase [Streptomyces sp. NPDC001100]